MMRELVSRALKEDIGSGDLTTQALVDPFLQGRGNLLAKQDAVIAGLPFFEEVFSCLDSTSQVQKFFSDGDSVSAGTVVLTVQGNFGHLLQGERTALNFVQRLSGIATLTRKFVDQTQETQTRILDTRKTTPTLRWVEKYAVRMGGGKNHRMGLFDEILIKDNHIAACQGSVFKAIQKTRTQYPKKEIVVEISDPEKIEEAIQKGVTRILLDNLENEILSLCLKKIQKRVQTEVSGRVQLERVRELAKLGVDFISVGALTHSAPAIDWSFKISPV